MRSTVSISRCIQSVPKSSLRWLALCDEILISNHNFSSILLTGHSFYIKKFREHKKFFDIVTCASKLEAQ